MKGKVSAAVSPFAISPRGTLADSFIALLNVENMPMESARLCHQLATDSLVAQRESSTAAKAPMGVKG